MRVFAAVSLNSQIQDKIRDFQDKMKLETSRFKGDIKWVFPDQCHTTLAFIGEVEDNKIKPLCDLIALTAEEFSPFRVKIEGVKAFGKNARVVWAAIKDGKENLCQIHEKLAQTLKEAHFYEEKLKFSPHITLARIKEPKAGKFVKDIVITLGGYPFGAMAVHSIELYQSELTKYGAKYTLLAEFPLGKTNNI